MESDDCAKKIDHDFDVSGMDIKRAHYFTSSPTDIAALDKQMDQIDAALAVMEGKSDSLHSDVLKLLEDIKEVNQTAPNSSNKNS